MKRYLFGIGGFCDRALADGTVSIGTIDGLFDNNISKTGMVKYGMCIQKPRYLDDTEVVITMPAPYHPEVLRQLLCMGYSRITVIYERDGGYGTRQYDFSPYHDREKTDCLIVLYLQHRSYSGISAIEYMLRNGYVTLPAGFRVVMVEGRQDETRYYYYAAMADYVITERGALDVYGKTIQLWHGFPLKAMGHMMKDFHTEGNKTSNLWQQYDHIASYGQMYTDFMCACYGTHTGQYWVTGMPRNDLLFMADGKKNLQEIVPDSADRKIVFYMPTFRELIKASRTQVDGDTEGYLFYWEDFDVRQLEGFCRKNNLYFVFKLHPSDASRVKTWCVSSEYIGILTDEMLVDQCMYEYLNAADLLITDYSSVYFDYLLLDRPIVFTDKDVDSYAAHRGLMLEPLEFWRPGAAVHTMDMLEQEVLNALNGKDAYGERRKCLLPLVHSYQDGDSTRRLLEAVIEDARNAQGGEKGNVPV